MPPGAATCVFTQSKVPPPMPPGAATCVFAVLVVTICAEAVHVALSFARVMGEGRQTRAGEDGSVGKDWKDPDWECHTRLETD